MFIKYLVLRWYRGVVMSSDSGMNQVFFLDYGDTEWISEDLCYELPKSLLQVTLWTGF